jgi:hypothetical protein
MIYVLAQSRGFLAQSASRSPWSVTYLQSVAFPTSNQLEARK